MTTQPPRLLLVEDDTEIAGMLKDLFDGEGYLVEVAYDGQRALHLTLSRSYDVLIVDRILPDLDGLDLLRRIRGKGVATPVLVLTALGEVADRVAGLDAGAEDYLVKPFEIEELLARVRALRRRHRDRTRTLLLGSGEIDLALRRARLADGGEVELSPREFELLRVLASRPRAVFTRTELRNRVFETTTSDSIVDTYIHYLRQKLGRGAVRTVRGTGYRAGEL
ncbi:response regulator transcription factor [Actinomadura sp. DC4]|uniref:response regulator transcription factor n=1 Tax=Actinomadura sp. DC4 TaxID=3055069 RepID=UPI0025B21519|nr:response regulator transcription factor [Actinomadura sp. DC4]MDN3353665.1 response regulator transcription factor [Actinomadura sp. DC4]